MRFHFGVIPLCLFGALAFACGGDDSGKSPSGSEFAQRYCALFKPCCVAANLPTTQESCHFMFGAAVAKDQAAAEDCIAEYEAWAKEADWCATFSQKPRPDSCKVAYPEGLGGSGGSKKPGEACSTSTDCASSPKGEVDCRHEYGKNEGYCRVVATVAVGAACVGTKSGNLTVFEGSVPAGALEVSVCDADAGAFCDNGTCAPRAALGATCGGYASCAGDDTYCSGTCKQKVPAGSSCSDSASACSDDAYCETATQLCKAKAADGATCSTNEECLSSYCYDGCKPNPGLGGLALTLFCI